ncbi:TPA: hypothetical protein VDV70_004261 [Pseudomonas aeruginosa]|uniref:hypothetical protein n=1 Tax=Pseudomonas aeruginosa TaxID=287 RepID=UPI001FFB45F3|nr:hypothetical protein [Pseudomonas aeruginosa]MCK1838888.1 hypothetical protein [Pseudomonas aeruginosa]HBN8638017.1 hypothetical protein [Pseudomonas aeruginosa]HBN9350690.1 hypothetical protein [Pseudomonas aeruginosa]HBN9351970.1 hypothetical protein [Pseudomonas aeruginosa]HCI2807283.1 hypothetical protein [Pseudomonas aeruginosa]
MIDVRDSITDLVSTLHEKAADYTERAADEGSEGKNLLSLSLVAGGAAALASSGIAAAIPVAAAIFAAGSALGWIKLKRKLEDDRLSALLKAKAYQLQADVDVSKLITDIESLKAQIDALNVKGPAISEISTKVETSLKELSESKM